MASNRSSLNKLLASVLSASLLFGAMPIAAFAEEESAPATTATVDSTFPEEEARASEDESAEKDVLEMAAASQEAMNESSGQQELSESDIASAYSAITDADIDKVMAVIEEVDGAANESISTYASSGNVQIKEFTGANRFQTSALQATYGWSSTKSDYAILSGKNGWPDALAASSLAGALDCPVLITEQNKLDSSVAQALSTLAVKHVIIVGGPGTVSDNVQTALSRSGFTVERLGGADRYATQLAIFEYGVSRGYWNDSHYIALAAGTDFCDALSFAPASYALKAPIFLTGKNYMLNDAQKAALNRTKDSLKGMYSHPVMILGGTTRVNASAESHIKSISSSVGGTGSTLRLAGADRYATSASIATWAVEHAGLSWNAAAFATGLAAADSLGGGALQGKTGSVLLLANTIAYNPGLNALASNRDSVSSVRYFGGLNAVSAAVRNQVGSTLDNASLSYTSYNISLSRLTTLEYNSTKSYHPSVTTTEISTALDPADGLYGTVNSMQFVRLTGYTGMTADQLNAYINRYVATAEKNFGLPTGSSKLRNAGASFVNAAKTQDLNEVYLLCHAILESGWGCSALARGAVSGYAGYLNFFGIGAYDADPNNGGAALAKSQGWNTVDKAVAGAAKWIKDRYIVAQPSIVSTASISGNQNTLYKMKWNVQYAAAKGSVTHQYATSVTWPTSIARLMHQYYGDSGISLKNAKLKYDYPKYL